MWNLRLKFDFTQDDTAILAYIIALLLRSQDKKKKIETSLTLFLSLPKPIANLISG